MARTSRAARLLATLLLVSRAIGLSTRRSLMQRVAILSSGGATAARAVDHGARSVDIPKLGRFAPNEGAKAFLGDWALEASAGGKTVGGRLVFKGNGDCQLFDGDSLLGESAVPWKYSSKDGVAVSFTLDLATFSDDVLILDGGIDEDSGILSGVVYSGDAEMGARGAGAKRKVGKFTARR